MTVLIVSFVVSNPLKPGALAGKRALVTGSSRGIGADTVGYFAAAGATVVVNYRNKEARALKLVAAIEHKGGTAIAVGADLTDDASIDRLFSTVGEKLGGLDILVMNASGGMERGMAADYAMMLNRDAQLKVLHAALPLLAPGARVVFVTSHQAHFIRTTETLPEYLPVALSKRAGEDALRLLIPQLDDRGIGFVVVSGDMIKGTITATLLERANPGAMVARNASAGRLYNVSEFAAEVALAAVEAIPANHTRYVGDVSDFDNTSATTPPATTNA
jgi:NAD(P)-dependent dehydrogenase (short-subunit alcohol dehydrogenase family)